MTTKTTPHRKPNSLVLVTLLIVAGSLATSLGQAAEPQDAARSGQKSRHVPDGENWWRSIWNLDRTRKLKESRHKVPPQDDAEGFNLARPFGKSGPTIQCSSSLPDSVWRSLRAGGDNQLGAVGTDTDIFVFLQKRW
jgi:hypothetical protein